MNKKSSAIEVFFGNLNRLVPFVGFLLVIAGILGLVFVQKPLGETQELRSDASEDEVLWPQLSADNQDRDLYVDEDDQISLSLRSGNIKIKSVNIIFNIINSDIEAPTVTINAGSGLRAEELEVEKVDDGYLVILKAVPNNLEWQIQPSDVSLIKVSFTPKAEGNFSINFDRENTYIETPSLAYAIDAQTINFDIKTRQDDTNDDDSDDEAITQECNESCDSNADCEVNYRCFDTGSGDKCRLATNPSNDDCSSPPDLGPNRQCNEYCADSRECTQGFSCWWNECRNPDNIESETCSDLTEEEEIASVNSCGESCASNADCAINLRCYPLEGTSEKECRLASNPSSLTCSSIIDKTVSQTYDQTPDLGDENLDEEEDDSMTPIKKGDDIIPDSERDYEVANEDKLNTRVNAVLNEDVPVDETAFDFLMKMLKDKQQSLPTTVILIGVGLLAASLLVLLIARLLNTKPKHKNVNVPTSGIKSHAVKNEDPEGKQVFRSSRNTELPTAREKIISQEATKDDRIKELMKELEGQSRNQNQG